VNESEITGIAQVVFLAVIVAGIARNRGIAPAIPLLATGLIVGFAPIGPGAPTDPEFVLVAVLAPLVFGEALSSSIVDLRRVSRPVMALAIGLVVFGAFVIGFVASALVPSMPFTVALCLGAILAPTDAVAVAATAKTAGLPRRLVSILEGESLVNDGTALTLLRVASVSAAAGTITVGEGAQILAASVLGGLLAGVVGGAILVLVVRRAADVTVVNSLILLAPFPIYFAAEVIGGSGILAVVGAALIVAQGTSSAITYMGRLQAASLWRTVTFILQATAFFLVGVEFPAVLEEMDSDARQQLLVLVPVVFLALVASRFAFLFAKSLFNPNVDHRKDQSWIIAAWSGTRGPISALAAFTLPLTLDDGTTPFPYRGLIISTTFCVVLITLLLAPTIAPLARRLNLPHDDDSAMLDRVRTQMARSALDRLEEIQEAADRAGRPISKDILDPLRTVTEGRLARAAEAEADDSENPRGAQDAAFRARIGGELVHAEQQELLRLRDEESLPDSMMRSLQAELDVRLKAIQQAG